MCICTVLVNNRRCLTVSYTSPMIRGVIFDLDGTLVHSLPGLTASLNRVLEKNNLPTHPENKVRGFIGHGIHNLIKRASPSGIDQNEQLSLSQQMSDDYATTWQAGSSAYPGVAKILRLLSRQGVPLAVFSNKPDRFCKEITDTLFPEILFEIVLGQRDGTPVKPDPTGALEAANILGFTPGQIAFLGDSTIDVATAHNAGMLAIAASWGYHDLPALKAETPHHIIHSIEELPAIFTV